jgi:hypothetical protein
MRAFRNANPKSIRDAVRLLAGERQQGRQASMLVFSQRFPVPQERREHLFLGDR